MQTARLVASIAVLVLGGTVASAEVISLPAAKDNAIFEELPNNSDGAGPELYAGNTAAGNHRRGLIFFDLRAIAPGSTILGVDLAMTVTGIPQPPAAPSVPVELHRLLADWGEAGSSGSGQGAPAQPNDVTWLDRFFPIDPWATAGADFSAPPSAVQVISGLGRYDWASPAMVADVQAWVNNPSVNFGWLLLGDESIAKTARAFASRTPESLPDAPVLTVRFIPAASAPLLSQMALAGLVLVLALVGVCTIALQRKSV